MGNCLNINHLIYRGLLCTLLSYHLTRPRVFLGIPEAQLVKNPLAMWETWVRSLGWDLLEKGIASSPNPFQYSCLDNPHRSRNLVGYSPRGCKELDTTELIKHSTE